MILVEAYNVVIRNEAISSRFSGGIKSFMNLIWNDTCTTDGELVRLGFMSLQTMIAYGKALVKNGLKPSRDFTFFEMGQGPLIPCSWIEWLRLEWFYERSKDKFTMAWLKPEYGGVENIEVRNDPRTAYPEWWTPEKAIKIDDTMDSVEINSRYKIIRESNNGVLTFFDRLLNRVLYSA